MTRCLYRQRLLAAGRHGHVHVDRIRRDTVNWTSLAPKGPTNHTHMSAIVVSYFGTLPTG